MNAQKFNFAGIILLLLLGLCGCDKEKSKDATKEDFCLYLNSENIDKTIPIINDYLSSLKSNLNDEQKLKALTEWLKSCPCIIDATILCVSCIYTDPAQSEISILLKENGMTGVFILDILMSNPLTAIRYCHHYHEIDVTLKNTDSYSHIFILGDEEGATIKVQPENYEISELIRDESTNMNVEYHYKPKINFVGKDYVVIEVHYNQTGVDPMEPEIVKINFSVTE